MNYLPQNLLVLLLSKLDLSGLTRMCQISSQLVQICNSDEFWRFKHFQEFSVGIPLNEHPKRFYLTAKVQELSNKIAAIQKQTESEISQAFMSGADPTEKGNMKAVLGDILHPYVFDDAHELSTIDFDQFISVYGESVNLSLDNHNITMLNGIAIDAPEFNDQVTNLIMFIYNSLKKYNDLIGPLEREIEIADGWK